MVVFNVTFHSYFLLLQWTQIYLTIYQQTKNCNPLGKSIKLSAEVNTWESGCQMAKRGTSSVLNQYQGFSNSASVNIENVYIEYFHVLKK